jgi:GAF domain-containing protein
MLVLYRGDGRASGQEGKDVLESSLAQQVEYILTQHEGRLRSALQYATQSDSGPEKGSDAWLLFHALITNDRSELDTCFEQSGRALAQQGGKLEARLLGLQSYVDALVDECRRIFGHDADGQAQLLEVTTRLYQLYSLSLAALTRGYQSVVNQVFLERQRVERLLEERLQVLQRINSISNSAMDLDQALESIARAVVEELHADLCSIFFYDELQRMLTLRATNGPRPLGGMHYTLRLGEGYSGWVADKGTPILVRDALSNASFASEARSYGQEYAGLMSLPIIFFGSVVRLIGVINVQTREPRDFTSEEMNFVEVVAGMVAINVENGRLYEQTDEQLRRKVHELATLHRVSSIIASTLDLDRVLQIITTQAVQLSGADRSCIFELDEDRRCLGVIASYGLNSAQAQGVQVPVGHCCAGRAVSTGRPSMAVDCFHSDEQCFMRHDPLLSNEMHSVLCVPLQVKQKVLGCICIYSSHRHMLSQEQMHACMKKRVTGWKSKRLCSASCIIVSRITWQRWQASSRCSAGARARRKCATSWRRASTACKGWPPPMTCFRMMMSVRRASTILRGKSSVWLMPTCARRRLISPLRSRPVPSSFRRVPWRSWRWS